MREVWILVWLFKPLSTISAAVTNACLGHRNASLWGDSNESLVCLLKVNVHGSRTDFIWEKVVSQSSNLGRTLHISEVFTKRKLGTDCIDHGHAEEGRLPIDSAQQSFGLFPI
jgi:hypothetical protein